MTNITVEQAKQIKDNEKFPMKERIMKKVLQRADHHLQDQQHRKQHHKEAAQPPQRHPGHRDSLPRGEVSTPLRKRRQKKYLKKKTQAQSKKVCNQALQ